MKGRSTEQPTSIDMTRKVFWEDPYQTELDATILTVRGDDVAVDQTIFYAEAGGQESDHGTFNNHRVLKARRDDREIIYTMEAGHGFHTGDPLTMRIDWDRRYRLMRLHFAAELILEWTYRTLPGIEKIGAHISPDKARIDFRREGSISDIFPVLEEKAGTIINSNLEIESAYSNVDAEKRYWKIDGFAQVPCGGTHLRRTGEIGILRLKRNNIGKGKERIEIFIEESNSR